jgi:hypothetical protein
MGVTSGYVELPRIEESMVGSTVALRIAIPLEAVAPGVYFLDIGASEGLGFPLIDQVQRAAAINWDVTTPEHWRIRFGDARISMGIAHSWCIQESARSV